MGRSTPRMVIPPKIASAGSDSGEEKTGGMPGKVYYSKRLPWLATEKGSVIHHRQGDKTMASAKIRVKVGEIWIEVDALNVKDAIKGLSEYMEIFKHQMCGVCQSMEVIPQHRNPKGYDFYEMVCLKCGAKLSFGQHKEGNTLFPRTEREDGSVIGAQGWQQWEGTQAEPSVREEGF